MKLINPVEFPPAKDRADKIVTSLKDRQVPNPVGAEIVGGIVIRGPAFGAVVDGVGLVGNEAWPLRRELIDRLAVSVLNVGRKSVAETMFELRGQRVETCIGVRREIEDLVETRIAVGKSRLGS
jgi:hypothetical protein